MSRFYVYLIKKWNEIQVKKCCVSKAEKIFIKKTKNLNQKILFYEFLTLKTNLVNTFSSNFMGF